MSDLRVLEIDYATPPTDGQVATYNASTGLWRSAAGGGGGGTIVGITGTMSEFNTAVTDGNILFNDAEGLGFRFENRTSDPGTPTVGQVWLRTDL